ncbi:hypothetical protein [Jiangella muralis]|uniref:hypothetical protein n=1 Tax=Jiangella muralis TaxID=702383 RepID=UPI00069F5F80|nr:hypothetical protein [Jiangella muralis]
MTNTTAAPNYIARDTYTGRHTIDGVPAGHKVFAFRAGEIAAEATEGVIWESFGIPRGSRREHLKRSRYVADAAGNLHVFNSDGGKTLIHPADRVIRVLRRV